MRLVSWRYLFVAVLASGCGSGMPGTTPDLVVIPPPADLTGVVPQDLTMTAGDASGGADLAMTGGDAGGGADAAPDDLSVTADLAETPDLTQQQQADLAAPCKADTDCKEMGLPRCDVNAGKCVPCLPMNDNCPMGKACRLNNGAYECADGCQKDADCQGGGGGGGKTCCKGTCVDIANDSGNCGACGMACAMGQQCCSSKCSDPNNDPKNCGGCNIACLPDNGEGACVMQQCMLSKCNQGFEDCDKIPSNGCEASTATDVKNCGGCGKPCAVANATPSCAAGKCGIGKCDQGFADCDKMAGNGCEIETNRDVNNCSACGMKCGAVANGTPGCSAGKCGVASCNGSFQDCDMNPANGCESDANSDVANCSKCGMGCPAPANGNAGCSGGKCGIASCKAPFGDCDKMAGTGCEIDTSKDVNHCNACGKACPAVANGTPGCAGGQCGIASCNAGYADCDKNAGNGCEVNLNTDAANCKTCGNKCPTPPNGAPACNNGVCGVAQCGNPYVDCDKIPANGCETDTSKDVNHCGACNMKCATVPNSTPACVASKCGANCTGAYLNCDGQVPNGCEVNGAADVNHCNGCGKKCPVPANATAGCTNSVCGIGACNAGFKDCANGAADGCEINTQSDANNCGDCGKKCVVANGTPKCTTGACGISGCTAPYADCKNGYADGCETNTSSDVNNCSKCGMVCPAIANGTPGCNASVCGIGTCTAPYASCDGNTANGCETNTSNNPSHCGACGKSCGGAACVNGVCQNKVLICGAVPNIAYLNDVKSKLAATGSFSVVDTIQCNTTTPSVATLQAYAAVLVFSDTGFQNSALLGDNLATYFDGGGRVVVATFANASVALTGRWSTGGYHLLQPAGQEQPNVAVNPVILQAGFLTSGWAKLTAPSAYRGTGGLINGGIAVARWGDNANRPLIIRGVKNNRAYVALNFYPPSAASNNSFWSGDGGIIMRNALLYKEYGPFHTFEGMTTDHYITQGCCSLNCNPAANMAANADYFCKRFYNNNNCTTLPGYANHSTPNPTYPKMHKNGGCTSNGANVPNTTCDNGPCKIGNWNENTSGLNKLICFCP